MVKIRVNRVTKVKYPLDIVWDNAQDYVHFVYTHPKQIKAMQVIFDNSNIQIFLYKSLMLPYLPFSRTYIAIRVLDHENFLYKQVYMDTDSGSKIYFHLSLEQDGDFVLTHNKFIIEVPKLVSYFPSLFAKFVNFRFSSMWQEDLEIQRTRNIVGGFDNDTCAPEIYTLYEEALEEYEDVWNGKKEPVSKIYEFQETFIENKD